MPTSEDFIFFSTKGGVLDPDNLQHYFSKLLKQLGLEHVKFHALRHTFATRALKMASMSLPYPESSATQM